MAAFGLVCGGGFWNDEGQAIESETMIAETRDNQLEALRQALPRLLGNLDENEFDAIRPYLVWDWTQLVGGELLFREGDPTDAIYLVMSGRLQASINHDGRAEVVGEIGRGESVGEMGAFTGEPRTATVVALRDSLLARFERSAFQEMLKACPDLALNFSRVIIDRLRRLNASQKPSRNVVTLAVLPITEGLEPGPLIRSLEAELHEQRQKVLHVTSEMVDAAAGRRGAAQVTEADNPGAHEWLLQYLNQLEGRYALLLLETDPTFTAWTQRCLRQADEVLLLGRASGPSALSPAEERGLTGPSPLTRARQTLVLLHTGRPAFARGTPAFLAVRPKVYRHFHLRASEGRDLSRLARFLSGRAVGLVLPGGGARGLCHIGVFHALEEAGIPIDAFGGTSIGSVLGACMAADWGWEKVYSENRREFLANPTSDFNLVPLVSILAGRKLDRILERSFSGVHIEELWHPYFCVSSSYTQACEVLHTRGNLKQALLASMAIPGVFPPVVRNRDLLVDGGVFNNMPVDVMARTGVQTILAVDLRGPDRPREINFDEVPSVWRLLMDRFKKRGERRYEVPSLITTLMAANTLNSQQKMSQVVGDVDLLFKPDVRHFGMLEWKSYDQIVDRGYQIAREVLASQPWPLEEAAK